MPVPTFDEIERLRAQGDAAALAALDAMAADFVEARPEDLLREGVALRPFQAALRLRPEAQPAVEGAVVGEAALDLANAIERARRLLRFRLRERRADELIVVSEGDSWFQYPLVGRDIAVVVSDAHPVFSIGAAGDTVAAMAASGEAARAVAAEGAGALMLSGGGNDLLGRVDGRGRLFDLLRDYDGQTDAAALIDEAALQDALADIVGAYRAICGSALEAAPDLAILLHGYAAPTPRPNGPWLREPMDRRAIPAALQKDVAALLIDRFYRELGALAAEFGPAAQVLDLRPATPGSAKAWRDELHPKDPGFRRASEPFLTALAAIAEARKGKPRAPASGGPGPMRPPALPESRTYARARLDICADLESWRNALSEEDFRAYEAVRRLEAEMDDPDTEARRDHRATLAGERPGLTPRRDLFAERILGASNLRGVAYLHLAVAATRAVGRVRAFDDEGGLKNMGTGFLVGGGLLLTNHHVLWPDVAQRSVVDFDFELAVDGTAAPMRTFETDPADILSDPALDFTLIGLRPFSRDGAALAGYGRLRLLSDSGKALKREPVSVIQHPAGRHKEIAIRDSRVIGRDGPYLYYTSDTEAGSSGSPVLSEDWNPVALHHRAVPDVNRPCAWVANRGVRISSILQKVRAVANDPGDGRSGIARSMLERIFDAPRSARGAAAAGEAPRRAAKPLAAPATISPEAVLGPDDRVAVEGDDERAAATLRLETDAGWGSGVAVGERLILTVAHVIGSGQLRIENIDPDGRLRNVGAAIGATNYGLHHGGASGPASELLGLRLTATRPLPARLIPTQLSPQALEGRRVEVLGYPKLWRGRFVGGLELVRHDGVVARVENGLIHYQLLDASDGQSGGPVVLAGTSKLVGLHLREGLSSMAQGLQDFNTGVHIDEDRWREIESWM